MTDRNGHTSTFMVGAKSAGTPGDPDPNPGDRGSVLAVQDANYGNTGTQFVYSYNQYGQKVSETNKTG